MCAVCQKRRKLVFSTGLWHPGTDTSEHVPLARELESRLQELEVSTDTSEHVPLARELESRLQQLEVGNI